MSYRFKLSPYKGPSSRLNCPSCGGKKEFAPYIDLETGELLPDHVGRCNRELNCGYHFTPKEFFASNNSLQPSFQVNNQRLEPLKPIDTIPFETLNKTLTKYEQNNLFLYFASLFRDPVAVDVCKKYNIGTSKYWPGAAIYWQVDNTGKVRTGKIMLYNDQDGKRVREPKDHITWVHSALKLPDFNYQQCFFGEQLLPLYPNHSISIVESEKTAAICSVYFPSFIWLATGGKYGCKWSDKNVCKVLKGRRVIMYPDADAFEQWKEKARVMQKNVECDIVVSDFIEKNTSDEQKQKGIDLADLLLNKCESTGLALVSPGYPAIFDYQINKSGADGVALVH